MEYFDFSGPGVVLGNIAAIFLIFSQLFSLILVSYSFVHLQPILILTPTFRHKHISQPRVNPNSSIPPTSQCLCHYSLLSALTLKFAKANTCQWQKKSFAVKQQPRDETNVFSSSNTIHYENNNETIEFNPRIHSKISPFELKKERERSISLDAISGTRLVI